MHWKILSFAGLLNLWISCSLSLQYTGWHSLVYMHLQYRKREIFLYCLLFHVTYTCIHSSAYWFSQYRHNSFVSFEGVLWSAFVSDYLNTTPEFIYFVGRILHTHKKKKEKREKTCGFDLNQCVLLWGLNELVAAHVGVSSYFTITSEEQTTFLNNCVLIYLHVVCHFSLM